MKLRINAKSIAALDLPPGKAEEVFWDGVQSGFGLRVRRSRGEGGGIVRTWLCQWKRDGITRKITLGTAPPVGAEAARQKAREILAKVALGEDPAAERRERAAEDRKTLRTLIDTYLVAKKPQLREHTFTERKRYLTGDYFKVLHNKPINSVRRADIAACIVRIEGKSGSAAAAQARAALHAFFTWSMQMGLVEHNPLIGTIKPAENGPRSRVLSDAELARVWRACDDGTEYSKIVKLMILTGCRRREIGGLRWSEFASDFSSVTIAGTRTKNKRPHTLPILPVMHSIIETCPRMVLREGVFGARTAKGFTNWTLPKPDLDKRAGVSDWVLHDIRRSVATKMADIGIAPHVIEAVLNHQSGHKAGVAGIYNKSSYQREVRAALGMWEDHLRTLVEGGERRVLNFQPPQAAAT